MERDWHKLLLTFDGRIGRRDWWIVYLVQVVLISIIAIFIGLTVFAYSVWPNANTGPVSVIAIILGVIVLICAMVMSTWMGLAASIKRYHDRHKSGWWVLIALIPYIGSIWQIIELGFLEGTIGSNEYGPDPIDRSMYAANTLTPSTEPKAFDIGTSNSNTVDNTANSSNTNTPSTAI